MSQQPIKCAARKYKTAPFYLIQSNGSDQRLVVSFQDVSGIKTFLLAFVQQAEQDLQVKIIDMNNPDHPVDYLGLVSKEKLSQLFNRYEEVIFHDGFHVLMIRHPDSGDYVVFDEHGLVFIYAEAGYTGMLDGMGLMFKKEENLIYEFDHWHYRPANAGEILRELIAEMGLEKDNCIP